MSRRKIELNEIQGFELDVLLKLINYLEENNISYCTSGGTTLGAIRHKGFIPWDDDIDLFIPRKDYDRLLDISKGVLIDGYVSIKSPGDKNYAYPYAKACNENTIINERNISQDRFKTGIFVDIFPLDKLYNSRFLSALKNIRMFWLTNMLNTAAGNINLSKKFSARWWFKEFLSAIQFVPSKIITTERIARYIDNYCKRQMNKDCRYIGCTVSYSGINRSRFKKEWFDEFIDGEFEGHKIKNPIGYDAFLKQFYGDYMKLPPKEQQIMHGFDAWLIK